VSVFSAVGGQSFFDRLAQRFYARVAMDEVLLRLYPDQKDLDPAAERLALFLAQFWGGPPAYSDLRGHPRLRMRHFPFEIGEDERQHWVRAMDDALEETMPEAPLPRELRDEVAARMRDYFDNAARHMVNQPEA
jgi:hemoglobin